MKRGFDFSKFYKIVFVLAVIFLVYSLFTENGVIIGNKILLSPFDNGGFESDLAGWSVSGSNVLIDSSESHAGDNSLRIIGGGHALAFLDELKGASGKSFTFSLWAKKDVGVVIQNKVGIQGNTTWDTPWERTLNIDSGAVGDWVSYSKTFTLPTDDRNDDYQILLASFPSSQPLEITNLNPINYVKVDILRKDLEYYLDRGYTIIRGIPQVLQDQNYTAIKTNDNDRLPVTFDVNKDVRVYLAWDMRGDIPDGWTITDTLDKVVVSDERASNDGTLKLIERDFSKGEVYVPRRAYQTVNYIIFVAPKESIWFDDVTLTEVVGLLGNGALCTENSECLSGVCDEVCVEALPDGGCYWTPNSYDNPTNNDALLTDSTSGVDNKALCLDGVWYVTDSSYNKDSYKNSIGDIVTVISANTVKGSWISALVSSVLIWTTNSNADYECYDSDGGLNYGVAGSVEIRTLIRGVIQTESDVCSIGISNPDITTLKEKSCSGLEIQTTEKTCDFGCSGLRCLTAEEGVKQVDLISTSIDKNICGGEIQIKCVMDDTFEMINGNYPNGVRAIHNFSSSSVLPLELSDSEQNTYVGSVLVSKTISGTFYAGCELVNFAPPFSYEEILKTNKSDYDLVPCPDPDEDSCSPILNEDLEEEDYDEGDRASYGNTPIYCYGGDWEEQKDENADCDDDYECLSDECDRHGECTSPGAQILKCFPPFGVSGGVTIGTKVGSQYCSSDGTMKSLQSDLESCAYSYECSSKSCLSGKCKATAECSSDSDCAVGKECRLGRCLDEAECTKDSDCASGKDCSSSGNCVTEYSDECVLDSDCSEGEVCNSSNECVTKDSPNWFWWVFGIFLFLSIIVLIIIWFVYKNKKIKSEPGRKVGVKPRAPPVMPQRGPPRMPFR